MAYPTLTARPTFRCSRSPATLVLAAAIATLTAPTDRSHAAGANSTYEAALRKAGEPIMAIVSIKSQNVTFYDSDGWILRAPVSTGVKGRETPAGVFAILQKNEDHRSNLYDDARMPHMQRLTWNGVAMHGGPLPGYAASHGCVRMPFDFAQSLFDKTRIGMRVIISPGDAAPVDFSHPALLVPDAKTVADAPARAQSLDHDVAEAGKAADQTKKAAAAAERDAARFASALSKVQALKMKADAELLSAEKTLTAASKAADDAKVRAEQRRLKASAGAAEADMQLASANSDAAAKIEAAAKAKEAAKAAVSPPEGPEAKRARLQAKNSADAAARAAARAKVSQLRVRALKAKADAELKNAEAALAVAMKAEAKARAEDRRLKAAAKAAEAATRFDSAKAEASAKAEFAVKAKDAAKAAAAKLADLTKAAGEAKLALQPVAVFISRAKQRLYVRRTTGKPWPDGGEVFDSSIEAPVTIRDPDKPIGTHVFTAMASSGTGLRWSAVTIDGGDDAGNALGRITFPQDILDRISPSALPKSSIIVSDEPLSRETNYRTEFVAVLNNQPQGGFKTRKPTFSVPVASSKPRYGGSGIFDFGYYDEPRSKPQKAVKARQGDPRRQPQWWW